MINAIATYGLTKKFEDQIAVNEVDLEIRAGEVFGLIGANGAGKTTLIRMLAAAEEPSCGEIYLNGDRLLLDNSSSLLKQRIGYLPDDYPLYDELTVWDYLDYFARLYRLSPNRRRRRLYEVLELIKLEHKRQSKIATLSRGMRQRLSLARTIIHEPMILLLDEPVSGLDPIARMQFREIIKVLQEAGMTVLISSHVLSDLAELCTSIGIMEFGFLVETASLADIYARLSNQYLIINILGDLEELKKELRTNSLVTGWEEIIGKNSLKVGFSGQEADRVELLRSLVASGISILEFTYAQEDLEEIFLKYQL
ncbi:MAG: ABC transporter ATP-binding protein [Cyanobacteria bacterium P01_F01_bin.143]